MGCYGNSSNPFDNHHNVNNTVVNEISDILAQFQVQLQAQLQEQFQKQYQDQDQYQRQLDYDTSSFDNIGNPTITVSNDVSTATFLAVAAATGFLANAEAGGLFNVEQFKELIQLIKNA